VDLKQYFKKVREMEASITEPYPLVTSLETTDGGKSGVVTEVSREIAARMIVEGRASLASDLQKNRYLEEQSAARRAAEKAQMAKRLQLAIVADPGTPGEPELQNKTSVGKK